jgi:hypothetical protein
MQKTFLKFVVFELVERIVRYRLLLDECDDSLQKSAPGLKQSLRQEADALEERLLSQKVLLNKLFSEGGAGNSKQAPAGLEPLIEEIYARLGQISRLLIHLKPLEVESETLLFLKDILPHELIKEAGEQSVFLSPEGDQEALPPHLLSNVLVDTVSVLQKNNPLGWVGLTQGFSRHLLENASSLEALKLELLKSEKKKQHAGVTEALVESLLRHAVSLRLVGPAYYFHALSEAVFARDEAFLHFVEPALFYGLNHQNFTHKSLVIMHEACERSKPAQESDSATAPPLAEEVLAQVFRTIEKLIPVKYAFQEKHMERAIYLQERLSQGVMLSSSPMYPVEEVSEVLESTRDREDFSIYAPLSMLTEYPHTTREIVNAGWLHKMERGPVWLYTILNEPHPQGFLKVSDLLSYQDHLLRKSIEVSEVHRVLLCGG